MEPKQNSEQNFTPDKEKEQIKKTWEKPEVSELGSLAKDTEGEFNFLNDGNQLT